MTEPDYSSGGYIGEGLKPAPVYFHPDECLLSREAVVSGVGDYLHGQNGGER